MTKKQKKTLERIIFSALFTIVLLFIPVRGWLRLTLYLIPYLIIGYDILLKAFKGIVNGRFLDENFLMAVATVGAIVLGAIDGGDYVEAIAVMLFYQVGELFQSIATQKSRKSITALMDIRPDYANVEKDGSLLKVDPESVQVGSVIVVCPGEKVPVDGIIISGESGLNMSPLTGESLLREVKTGDEILSGSINTSGLLKVRTTREFGSSTVCKILELVENASSNKSRSEDFISKFAKFYTPIVCLFALFVGIIPPLVNILFLRSVANWGTWIYRALAFLVASCPCALVVSIPLTFFAGIGGASRRGILVKGSNYLETLSKTKCAVFDKTGTLTQGVFEVTEICSNGISREQLLEYSALAETSSLHPIAKSLERACPKTLDRNRVSDITEIGGFGVTAKVDGLSVAVGNNKLMQRLNINYNECESYGTVAHVAIDGVYRGYIVISDVVKPTSQKAIDALKKTGVEQIVMLTGDGKKVAEKVCENLKIDKFYSELLPNDKVEKIEELIAERKGKGKIAFVGDGINDAPVLSRADIGIAMGKMGSDAAIESADVVLMDDNVEKIAMAIRISKKCLSIVYENIIFAIGIKIFALVAVALGLANMWLAIFADVGVTVLAVLNATRALFSKKT